MRYAGTGDDPPVSDERGSAPEAREGTETAAVVEAARGSSSRHLASPWPAGTN
ncbi:hypothetical protein [Streptomyces piniterrae]|uniref:hypothetical protein n=1 Tax=Streptomyces piniterrae TaxID=2571125 RepID=UPI00145E491D|nr:hypothetical protein [Streptomyces piniterrae]